MNVSPKREGFISDEVDGRIARPMVDVTPEKPAPERKSRPTPEPAIEPSPAEQSERLEQEWPITVKLLHKPIRNNKGEKISEITLREPRASDINRYGNPVRIDQEGEVRIEERKMTFIIAALSDILPPFIEDMHPRDWNSVAFRLQRFFLPDPAAW
ncbi:phage tail assembly protein [Bradyrhizobium sp. BRP22]|uniref:phage tail assembly protein n=1 Tax=Bradyrhizobium sp. BRP22 TaxID=2793821 RepID=UPI001CD45137|nr:phage tail assembly protein [Bradyrhizobium sp. BRP22]MCA1452129.1 phage tail assembly protein [Bradyrhizobium sp. BRP22]